MKGNTRQACLNKNNPTTKNKIKSIPIIQALDTFRSFHLKRTQPMKRRNTIFTNDNGY